jgi:hypothetical protein
VSGEDCKIFNAKMLSIIPLFLHPTCFAYYSCIKSKKACGGHSLLGVFSFFIFFFFFLITMHHLKIIIYLKRKSCIPIISTISYFKLYLKNKVFKLKKKCFFFFFLCFWHFLVFFDP